MRIGIIGAGNMGATLAAQLTQLGHQVAIANFRGPQTLAGVAAQTGATPVPITQVTATADVVIAAIPEKSIPELPAGLLSALPDDTVVIDTGNYVPELRDGHIDAIDAGLPESQWVQAQLHHPVVKAFNTIRPASLASLGKPAAAAGRTVSRSPATTRHAPQQPHRRALRPHQPVRPPAVARAVRGGIEASVNTSDLRLAWSVLVALGRRRAS